MVMVAEPQDPVVAGHAFISYVREDLAQVDRLQRVLQDAGIPVWLDRSDLWPGEDWQAKIREAITDDALVFIACFSSNSLARVRSYQNEELVLAVEQLRLRRPDVPWLIPVRFDDCRIPDRDIGGGRRLSSLQRVDLFDDSFDASAARLVAAIQRILGPARAGQDRAEPRSSEDGRRAHYRAATPGETEGVFPTDAPGQSQPIGSHAFTGSWHYTSDGFEATPLMNMVHTAMPGNPGTSDQSPFVRIGVCVSCQPVSQDASSSRIGTGFVRFLRSDHVATLVSSLTHVGDELSWVRLAGHGAIRLEAALGDMSETAKPAASAMLLPPVAGLQMHGRPDDMACLWLHIEPRGPEGSTARPASLGVWHQRLQHAISLAARFNEFLVGDLSLATHDDPTARVGVMLNTAPITRLIDTGPLRPLPGAIPSHQFLGYAIADGAGQPARNIARTMLAQLCEYTLHLDDFEPALAGL
jgi:TIR domain